MTITRGKQPDKWVPRSWVLDLIDDLAAARREPCPDCRESASGVCTMHNGSFSLGARRDPEPVASADPMQTFLDADPKWTPQEQAEWKASHPEPVASADAARVLDGNDAALKLAVGKTPGQADWLRPVTITDVLAAIRGTASPLDRVTLAEAIISAGLVRRGSFAYDWADAILARLRATEGTDV
jgi:hypothetical protein